MCVCIYIYVYIYIHTHTLNICMYNIVKKISAVTWQTVHEYVVANKYILLLEELISATCS